MWQHLWKSTLVGEEKPAAGINATSSGKCQQIDFSGIAARCLTEVEEKRRKSWQHEQISKILVTGSDKVISTEFIKNPQNSILYFGCSSDLIQLMMNPSLCKTNRAVSLSRQLIPSIWFIIKESSKKNTNLIPNLHSNATTGFRSIVKLLGTKARLKAKLWTARLVCSTQTWDISCAP